MIHRVASLVGRVPRPPLLPDGAVPWVIERSVGSRVVSQAWADCFASGFSSGFAFGAVVASIALLFVLVAFLVVVVLLKGSS